MALIDDLRMRPSLYAAPVPFRGPSILLKLLASLVVSGAILTGQSTNPLEIKAIRQGVVKGTTSVEIEFSGDFEYRGSQLDSPERIYFDFPRVKLGTELPSSYSKEFAEETISGIRVAEPSPGMTRVVLDLLGDVNITIAKLKSPARLLIELRPRSAPTSQIPTRIPPTDDSAPRPAIPLEATPPVKPLNLELAGGTEPAPVQPQPGLIRRHTLKLSPISAAPGTVAAVQLALDSPAGEEPQALQWELSYPSPKLGAEDGDLGAGSVASSAGKSMVCAGRVENAGAYVYRCILAGGLRRIPNGPVAVISFRVRPYARSGAATVRISKALAVTADGKEVLIQPSEADITIR